MSVVLMPVRSRLKVLIAEKNLERARAGQDLWTIRELAIAAGLSPSVVSGLTTNRAKQAHFDTLSKLCAVLDCAPGDLLEYIPSQKP
jgi:putative transcriptional regulator